MMNCIKQIVYRTFLIVTAVVFVGVSNPNVIYAYDQQFYSSNNILFYNPDACSTGTPSSAIPSQTATTDTDEQKIASTFIIGFDASVPKEVVTDLATKYHIGGMYLTGTKDAAGAGFNSGFYQSLEQAAGGKKMVIASDEEGAVVHRYNYGSTSFPSAGDLSKQSDDNITKTVTAAAKVMKDNGIIADLAPVLDLRDVGDSSWATGRSFSRDPSVVADKAGAFAAGLEAAGVKPIFKHFPGFDSTTSGTTDDVKVIMNGSIDQTVKPYQALLAKYSDGGVMLSNMYVTKLDASNPSSMSAPTVTYIRNTLKFNGLITTDDLGVKSVIGKAGSLESAVSNSIQAGVTMPLFGIGSVTSSTQAEGIMDKIIAAVKGNSAAMKAIDTNIPIISTFAGGPSTGQTGATGNGCCQSSQSNVTGTLSGSDNLQKVYNFFLGVGLSDIQAAGVVGNIAVESAGYPNRLQGKPPEQGSNNPADAGKGGYGLIQWTPGAKLIDLLKAASISGNVYDLQPQLAMVWWHMQNTSPTGASNMVEHYKTITDVTAATVEFEQKVEAAGDPNLPARIQAAKLALSTYPKNPSATTTSTSATTGCSCPDPQAQGTADVVLDPGHAPGPATHTSPEGILDGEYENEPEMKDVWDVTQLVMAQLKKDGYSVLLTKTSLTQPMALSDRAAVANNAKAQIALSIHDQAGANGGVGFKAGNNLVYYQAVGRYRETTSGKKITFTDTALSATSKKYADIFVKDRAAAQGVSVQLLDGPGEQASRGHAPGNMWITQLLSKVPWIYNEAGGNSAGQIGLNAADKQTYANGLIKSIEDSVKPSSAGASTTTASSGCDGGAVAGDAVKTALSYAWPTYQAGYTTKKKVYQKAIQTAIAAHKYVGDSCFGGGVDCGGFVTRVMQDSGTDPNYGGGGNTASQLQYMLSHPELYEHLHPNGSAGMQPGDIAVQNNSQWHHTYMYVGSGLTGTDDNGNSVAFATDIASASQCDRAPMAGHETAGDPAFEWFRKK